MVLGQEGFNTWGYKQTHRLVGSSDRYHCVVTLTENVIKVDNTHLLVSIELGKWECSHFGFHFEDSAERHYGRRRQKHLLQMVLLEEDGAHFEVGEVFVIFIRIHHHVARVLVIQILE